MDSEKYARTLSLIIVVLVITLHIITDDYVAIYTLSPFKNRLLYHFYHTNILHLILNVWCFLNIIFYYDIKISTLVLAYIVCSLYPVNIIETAPTIGLSAICYYLLGIVYFKVKQKLYYQIIIAFYLVLGFVFPISNSIIHLYSYIIGFIVGFINTPLWKKK